MKTVKRMCSCWYWCLMWGMIGTLFYHVGTAVISDSIESYNNKILLSAKKGDILQNGDHQYLVVEDREYRRKDQIENKDDPAWFRTTLKVRPICFKGKWSESWMHDDDPYPMEVQNRGVYLNIVIRRNAQVLMSLDTNWDDSDP